MIHRATLNFGCVGFLNFLEPNWQPYYPPIVSSATTSKSSSDQLDRNENGSDRLTRYDVIWMWNISQLKHVGLAIISKVQSYWLIQIFANMPSPRAPGKECCNRRADVRCIRGSQTDTEKNQEVRGRISFNRKIYSGRKGIDCIRWSGWVWNNATWVSTSKVANKKWYFRIGIG